MDNLDKLIICFIKAEVFKCRVYVRSTKSIRSNIAGISRRIATSRRITININHRDINKLNILYNSQVKYILAGNKYWARIS